ncbi:hypothetical protein [Streptomyces sp. JV190]|uniref:hypothetical protein n=1 Tax=Streptomyces sp. JV190 TaxID=3002533 RepID=UPI002E761768|nr:hypothetical protein [Streptomyces sp. JV190]MEE1838489.1 hypothetical protein [Streptomyces sp. JV190]
MTVRIRPGRGLRGPRHAGHTLAAEHLGALSLPVGDDGVILGTDAEGRTQMIGFHRPAPYDVLLIGGLWTAQVLALRAAATGARVAVETGRTRAWTTLAQAAGAGLECVSLHDVGRVPPTGAAVSSPVVVVRDCGMRPPRGRVVSSPWQSVLTLLPYLSPVAPRLMRASTLVGVQRVSPAEAEQVGRILGLARTESEALPTLADGVTLWVAGRERHWVMTGATEVETGLLGAARRMD